MPQDPGTTKRCLLEEAFGHTVPCGESGCVFWEPGGAVLHGRCAFEHLDLRGRPEVAGELLQIRARLEAAADSDAERTARHLYHQLLNRSEDD
ncbi:MAG TPA: hypothetical protein VIG35_02795 [Gaiellaceae bacterium]|jgi:hypothetical protein